MNKSQLTHHGRNIKTFALGTLCLLGAFVFGIETAGEVEPITLGEAGNIVMRGDLNANGVLDREDVAIVLEVVQGYRQLEPHLLQADPNGDGRLTVDDAIAILDDLSVL
jgi:hypothetical protein